METNYYRNFLAIVDEGNMTNAAQRLHVTQPTLSKQLQILEREYNADLLTTRRGSRAIYLTEAGKLLYRRAKQICEAEELLGAEVKSASEEVSGTLRFSISNGRSPRLIRKFLAPFRAEYPLVSFELHEGIITTQEEELLSGETDIGICTTALTEPEKFDVLFSREERLALIASADFEGFPAAAEITAAELSGIPLSVSGGVAEELSQKLGNWRETLDLVSVTTTRSSALIWAETGKVAALIPVEPGEIVSPELRLAYVSGDFSMKKSVVLPKGRPVSRAARAFLEYYAAVYGTGK